VRLGVSSEAVITLSTEANTNGTDFQSELLASNLVSERDLFCAIALELGIGFLEEIDPDRLIMTQEDRALFLCSRSKHLHVWTMGRDGRTRAVIVPSGMSLNALKDMLHRNPSLLPVLHIATPGALRRAILSRAHKSVADEAKDGLYDRFPDYSARIVATAWQGLVLGAFLVILVLAFAFAPAASFASVHVFFSLFFLACIGLRFAAATAPPASPPQGLNRIPSASLPFTQSSWRSMTRPKWFPSWWKRCSVSSGREASWRSNWSAKATTAKRWTPSRIADCRIMSKSCRCRPATRAPSRRR
jgi:hypothetical protein